MACLSLESVKKKAEWFAGSGFLFRPWLIAGLVAGVVLLTVLAVTMGPWHVEAIVPFGHLPVVRSVPTSDREWDDVLVLTIDAEGGVWSGTERADDLGPVLRSFSQRTGRLVLVSGGNRVIDPGEVLVRAHRECSWHHLRSVLRALQAGGFFGATLACRADGTWDVRRYLYVVFEGPWDAREQRVAFEVSRTATTQSVYSVLERHLGDDRDTVHLKAIR